MNSSPAGRCPTGVGVCSSDSECLGYHPLPSKNAARCAPEGLRYDLEAELDICMPEHCFDGTQNFAEIAVDCGGPCGSQCPVCPDTTGWASFEDSVRSWAVVDIDQEERQVLTPGPHPRPLSLCGGRGG